MIDIQQLLQPIYPRTAGPAVDIPRRSGSELVIAVFGDKHHRRDSFQDWRFVTPADGFLASYHERWVLESREEDLWILNNAYLSLYKVAGRNQSEFICLHCDPNVSDDDEHYGYKRGPHVHVVASDPPIPAAHLALYAGKVETVLESGDTLFTALGEYITLFKRELLDSVV